MEEAHFLRSTTEKDLTIKVNFDWCNFKLSNFWKYERSSSPTPSTMFASKKLSLEWMRKEKNKDTKSEHSIECDKKRRDCLEEHQQNTDNPDRSSFQVWTSSRTTSMAPGLTSFKWRTAGVKAGSCPTWRIQRFLHPVQFNYLYTMH